MGFCVSQYIYVLVNHDIDKYSVCIISKRKEIFVNLYTVDIGIMMSWEWN